jgi:hypothetical protein
MNVFPGVRESLEMIPGWNVFPTDRKHSAQWRSIIAAADAG